MSKLSSCESNTPAPTVIDLIWQKAASTPEKVALRYCLSRNVEDAASVTFAELQQTICNYSDKISQKVQPGEVALIANPGRIEFWFVLLGCMHARVIPSPLPLGESRAQRQRLENIISDSKASALFCISQHQDILEQQILGSSGLLRLPVVPVDDFNISHSPVSASPATPDDIAVLQYTSGSTGSPKGIALTHNNINTCRSVVAASNSAGHRVLNWLPPFHDFGLISLGLWPLCNGETVTHIPTGLFLRAPSVWFEFIEHYRITFTGITPTAADLLVNLCERKRTKPQFNLSSLSTIAIGAEPVTDDILSRLEKLLVSLGCRKSVLSPSYGLAEATVCVSAIKQEITHSTLKLDAHALKENRVELLPASSSVLRTNTEVYSSVSCGSPISDTRAGVVDPTTLEVSGKNEIGEIWVRGSTVANGYWRNPDATKQTFQAYTRDGEGPWLRTGDLGFIHKGEIYITGRLKDLIIINGQNIYPQDIEETVSKACFVRCR